MFADFAYWSSTLPWQVKHVSPRCQQVSLKPDTFLSKLLNIADQEIQRYYLMQWCSTYVEVQGLPAPGVKDQGKSDKRTVTRILQQGHLQNFFQHQHDLKVPAHGLGVAEQRYEAVIRHGVQLTEELERQVCTYPVEIEAVSDTAATVHAFADERIHIATMHHALLQLMIPRFKIRLALRSCWLLPILACRLQLPPCYTDSASCVEQR